MLRLFLALPLFFLLLFFASLFFLGVLLVFFLQFLTRSRGRPFWISKKYKYTQGDPASAFPRETEGECYREIIDLENRKKKKWITVLTLVLIVIGFILLNYLKVDERGKIYWERKQQLEQQDYV